VKIDLQLAGLEIVTDETAEQELPDDFGKFLQDAQLAAGLNLGSSSHQHVANLRAETSERNNAVRKAYKSIAEQATAKNPAPAGGDTRLEKRARRVVAGDANDTRKVARTETTKYSSGKMLVAEIDEIGEVIRVIEQAA
jgi:hypothetical protein